MKFSTLSMLIACTFILIFNIGLKAEIKPNFSIELKSVLNSDSSNSTKKSPSIKPVYNKKRMVFSTYVVKDFSKWEKVYNEKSDAESKFAYSLKTDTNISKIGVFQFTTSLNDFRKNITSKQNKDFISQSGIKSTPENLFLNVMWMNPEQQKKDYYILISHKVVDYVKWKVLFDGDRGNRGMFGISDVFVATQENDINYITTLFTTDNFEMCKELFANEEILNILKVGGVIGEIKITYWKIKSK